MPVHLHRNTPPLSQDAALIVQFVRALAEYDLVLSYTGGRALEELRDDSISGSLTSAQAPVKARAKRRPLIWIPLAVLVMGAGGAGLWFGRGHRVENDLPITAVPLTSYPGKVQDPSFSPDGNQIAFTWDGEKQDNNDVYIKLVGPGNPLRLTTDPASDRSPAWSPDGRSIAFMRYARSKPGALMLMPALGGTWETTCTD